MLKIKNIVKNTSFLYIRMFLIMGVTLYTSRVILNVLGVEDYGIYSIVGGIVVIFNFFNSAMSTATQRYLSFDIGQKNFTKLHKTFNVSLIIHIGIALIILILSETIGLWYVNNKLNISQERMLAVNYVYQFSVVTSLIGVVQIPFNALIIARERMNVFAMFSIVEVVLKLGVIYFLVILNIDKLVLYSFLILIISFLIALAYRIYCLKKFPESRFKIYYDKSYYKELLAYSGWNLFGNIASVSKGQGVNILLNLFFGTIVNAAYGITMQVQSAVSLFVNNLQLAINPQIVKNYSIGNMHYTRMLILYSSKYSFFLLLIISLPLLLNTEYILILWLNKPPLYTFVFVKLCIINLLIDTLSRSLMIGAQATGEIKNYQIVVGLLVFLNLPFSFIILKLTNEPSNIFIVSIIISLITLQFRLYFLKKVLLFNILEFYKIVMIRVFIVLSLFYTTYFFLDNTLYIVNDFFSFAIYNILMIIFLLLLILIFGVSKKEINYFLKLIKNKL